MINRDRYLITKNILYSLSMSDRSPTKIMYACRLSNYQRHEYLESLVDKELVKRSAETGRIIYSITGKGMQVLEILKNLYSLCPFIMDAGLNEPMDSYKLI